ncbi:MAG: ABC transporter ATP-binding protein [Anaerolineae bacterium]|nr:ABC transporter ATP-binding protein [Anaerolineae bacterium]MCB9133530.1 ABC transporter ATP-binding protein [Anaerolineales bacterium]MCB0230207.1 ABC transporter ATP-binding protein [Anaerolineae bacterium]MCB0234748.1 ABC transporter ATP-binding protein [Anaerolineae bacterium]MCB0237244.1 ABC transporter ATP-binding protein [Anaerolineae bacterium]
MAAPAIHTDQLSKYFTIPTSMGRQIRHFFQRRSDDTALAKPVLAVDKVSLDVYEGELFGLLGPNGAGKTTFIKLLCTMIVASSGTGSILGADLSEEQRIREMVGLASGDERSFYWRLTGRQNLEFFGILNGLAERDARQRADELIRQVDMVDKADKPVRTYSSGQKQRMSIARALLHHPRVLFLDEPTRSLDPTATHRLHHFIREELMAREGMTIILTTHRLDEAELLSNRIGIMNRGVLQAVGTPAELRNRLDAAVSYRIKVAGLDGDPHSLAGDLPCQLSAEPGAGGWLIEIETSAGESLLAAVIERIVNQGGQVLDVERDRPSLEVVFQRFTEPVDAEGQA